MDSLIQMEWLSGPILLLFLVNCQHLTTDVLGYCPVMSTMLALFNSPHCQLKVSTAAAGFQAQCRKRSRFQSEDHISTKECPFSTAVLLYVVHKDTSSGTV